MYTHINTLLLCFFCTYCLHAQDSFVKKIGKVQAYSSFYTHFSFNQTDKIGFPSFALDGSLDFISLNMDGSLHQTTRTLPILNNSSLNYLPTVYDYKYLNNYHIVNYIARYSQVPHPFGATLIYHTNTQDYTALITHPSPLNNTSIIPVERAALDVNTEGLLLNSRRLWPTSDIADEQSGLGLFLYDIHTDQQRWNKWYTNDFQIRSATLSIKNTNPNNYILIAKENTNNDTIKRSHIVALDTIGQIQEAAYIESDIEFTISEIDQHNNIYLAGVQKTDEIVYGSISINIYNLVITKLSPDLNTIWTKRIEIDEFSVQPAISSRSYNIVSAADNSLVFSMSSSETTPAIIGRLSAEGELISYNAYNVYSPRIFIAPDQSLYVLNSRSDVSQNHTSLTKLKPDGSIDDCSYYPTCLSTTDLSLQMRHDVNWQIQDIPALEHYEVDIQNVDYELEDDCIEAPYPSPLFTMPDTICQYSCLSPQDLSNQSAQTVQWHIQGPALDSIIENINFNLCFDEIGLYIIEQTIWSFGCSLSHQDSIWVLSDDLSSLADSIYACQFPYQLSTQSSRPLQSILWNTADTTTSIMVNQAGTYWLSADDGYCFVQDTIHIKDIQELVQSPVIIPIADTTLCPDLLPYVLLPQSPYTDSFSLNGQAFLQSANIIQAGTYTLSTAIEGCVFEQDFELIIQDCTAPIFIPNVFSPNNDGINDKVYAQGLDFTPQYIEVYDRWGGLIYQSTQAPFSWDGKEANNGTYIFVLKYFNHRNQQYESVVQDVVLLR